MNRFLLLLSLLLTTGVLAAQSFTWGVHVYPNYANRRLIALGVNITDKMIQEIEAEETGRFSMAGGLRAGWRGEKVGFQFGLELAETGYQTVQLPIPEDSPNPDGASAVSYLYRNWNLVVPAGLEFVHELGDKNAILFLLGGAAGLNLSNQTVTRRHFGDRIERSAETASGENFRTLNFAVQTAVGWERRLGQRTTFYAQPTFQFWLHGLLQDAELNRSLYDLGVKVGVRFSTPGN